MQEGKKEKRKLQIVVISDVHLGTYGSHSKELSSYLKSIETDILILNGDIIDGWSFSKRFWPKSHTKVMQRILKMMSKGTMVYYLTGNHDEMLRKYSEFSIGNFCLLDKLVLTLDEKRYWFFHGDVFDITMKNSKFLAKLGGTGYDMLIVLNRFVNFILEFFGREKISFSKKVKDSVKRAVQYISDFETTVAELAIKGKYDYAVCGHIHHPLIRTISTPKGEVTYMNSGDWVENLTALEYNKNQWQIFKYEEEKVAKTKKVKGKKEIEVPVISILPDLQKIMNR